MSNEPPGIGFRLERHPLGDDVNGRRLNTKENYKIRDLFNHKELGPISKNLKATIGSHDVLMVRLKK